MLNGFFKGGVEGVEDKAYVYLVVGVGLGESGSKGFGLHVNKDLSRGLLEEKVGEVKEGQGRNLVGGIRGAAYDCLVLGFGELLLSTGELIFPIGIHGLGNQE